MSIALNAAKRLGLVREVQPAPGTTPSGLVVPPREPAAGQVTPRQALTLAAVYRAVSIIATGCAQLGLGVWRKDTEVDNPSSLVTKPDVNMPRAAFLELTAVSLATTGNAFWRKHRTAPTDPVLNLEVIPPAEVAVSRDENGRVTYSHAGKTLTRADVSHLQLLRVPGAAYGLGPIQAASAELRGAIDLRDYSTGWFHNSGIPNGVLKTDQPITDVEAQQYRERVKSMFKPGEPAVLGKGLSYDPLLLNPKDAQFLENRAFTTAEIARMFGIPVTYLAAAVEGSSDTYANMEQVDITLVRYTLMAYLREMETALSDLLPHGQEARFKVDALLRTDAKTRMETYSLGIAAGIYSPAWVQKVEGLPAYTAPRTTTPVTEETNA